MRKKILILTLVALSAGVISVAAVVALKQHASVHRSFAEQQNTLVEFAADNLELILSVDRLASAERVIARLQGYSMFEGIVVYDDEMRPTLTMPDEFHVAPPLIEQLLTARRVEKGHVVYEVAALMDNEERLGTLVIAFTMAPLLAEARQTLAYAMAVAMLVLIPIMGYGIWMVRQMERDAQEKVEYLKLVEDSEERMRNLNAKLTLAMETVEENNRLKSEFLSNTSHELRSPLNSIIGFQRLILRGYCDNPEEERAYLKNSCDSAEHLLRLIDDILDIAHIEAGKMSVALCEVPLDGLFGEVKLATYHQAEKKGLQLKVELPTTPSCTVYADPPKLKQALINIVGNAIKFTSDGSIRLRAVASSQSGFVDVFIEDTGIGIAPHRQGRLFEAFVQVDGSVTREFGGNGLGLAIAKRLVEIMGGSIRLHSEGEGMGTTVTVSIPTAEHVQVMVAQQDVKDESVESPTITGIASL